MSSFASQVERARRDYEALGFITTPLRPFGKAPLARDWQQGAGWSSAPLDANIGIVTGAPSKLVVLDFDSTTTFDAYFPQGPAAVARTTPVVRTSRGYHVWTRAVREPSRKLEPSVDLKADGGLIVAPPSIHASGRAYAFVGDACEPAVLADVLAISNRARVPTTPAPPSSTATPAQPRPRTPFPHADVFAVERRIANAHPKLYAHWRGLIDGGAVDRSRAEFVIALALLERGDAPTDVERVLRALPNGKAREREHAYAARTVERASMILRRRTL